MSTKALETAKAKGRAAAAAGLAATDNPYMDKRKSPLDQRITWSRAFRRAWFEGYDEVKNERLRRPVCRRR